MSPNGVQRVLYHTKVLHFLTRFWRENVFKQFEILHHTLHSTFSIHTLVINAYIRSVLEYFHLISLVFIYLLSFKIVITDALTPYKYN